MPEARKNALLIYTSVPGRAGEMIRALEAAAASSDPAYATTQSLLRAVEIDRSSPAAMLEEVIRALRAGYDGPPGHLFLIVCGDVADELSPKRLADLRKATLNPRGLAVVGVAEDEIQHGKLAAAGIIRIVEFDKFAEQVGTVAHTAYRDLSEQAAARMEQAASSMTRTTITVAQGAPQDGLLPNSGLIVFHANKGGTGKTTMATSIAYFLSLGRPVAFADFNPSGGFAHNYFDHWLRMPRNGGFQSPRELFLAHGLNSLARNINHAEAQQVSLEALKQASIRLEDPANQAMNLTFLPGIRAQEDFEVGNQSPQAAMMRNLIQYERWAEQTLDGLRRLEGGRGYVVVDTDTVRTLQMTRVPLKRADLLVLVVDGRGYPQLYDEFDKTETLVNDPLIEFNGHLMVVVNQLFEGEMRRLNGNGPSFREAEELFRQIRLPGRTGRRLEIVPAPMDASIVGKAGKLGKPVLAVGEYDTPLSNAMVNIVNVINGSASVQTSRGKGKGLGLFGKKR